MRRASADDRTEARAKAKRKASGARGKSNARRPDRRLADLPLRIRQGKGESDKAWAARRDEFYAGWEMVKRTAFPRLLKKRESSR